MTRISHRRSHRILRRGVAVTLLISGVTAGVTVSAPQAFAAGTVLFNQPFHDNTVDGPAGSVSLPTSPTGTNVACLSAAGNATANPLASCPAPTDAQGSGKLRLTPNATTQEGGVFASATVPTSQGLDVTFNSYQYGGSLGADGMAFVLAAVDPANPVPPAAMGQSGGALGYSAPSSNVAGLTHGYLGIGLDVYGNYSAHYEGLGCSDPANIAQRMPGQVVVRGPGNGGVGYCALASSAATATSPPLILRATARAASLVPVEVVYNPSSSPVTTPSGLTVPAGDYDVHFTPVGGTPRDVVGALPTVPAGLYPASWVNASGFPKQLAFGWVASTGSVTDYHEIDNAVVTTLNPVPQLAVSQTSYAAATLSPGSPVTYQVAASSSGAAENSPVTVTETVPAGVLPVGASGVGWVCGVPSGQQVSCTSSGSPFTSGTITVNAVVKSSGVTPAVIQSSSTVVASSADASPATSSSAPAGTVPAAPAVTGISPTNGAAGGGNDVTVTGTNLGGATAIEIGTAAEFAAGTPIYLRPCSSAGPGCFTVSSATSLDISSMPAHAAGAVLVSVVSLGVAGTGGYTYNTGPALLFPPPPGGEVGVAYSDQLTVTGGTSPFTWSVSAGTLPPGLALGAATGLLSGTPTAAGSYSFTVMVTDHAGLSATEPVTMSVIAGPSLGFPAPPAGWTHTVYSDTLTVSGGTSPYAWSVSSGAPPAGISLSADGVLTGTPTAVGTASFTVRVTDASGQSATQATSITISAGVSATFAAPPAAVAGTPYSTTLTATGGTTPYTWSVNAGTLPPGLALSSAGVLAGTPSTAGSYPFSVNVIDKNGGIATAPVTLVVGPGLSLTFGTPPGGQVGVPYADTLTAAGGTTPYTWSVSAGTLPAGITLGPSTGVLAGTPTAGGTSNFTIKVTDAAGQTAAQPTAITILAGAMSIAATASAATTTPGATVSYTVKVTNTGPVALTGATFTDPLAGVLDDAAYNSNASATAGAVSFASPNLTWTGNLAIGASATITFSVTVSNPDTGNKILAATITSATPGSNCASGSTDPACTLSIPVAVLTIAATASASTATPGTTVSYTVTVTNSGQVAYPAAAFTDALAGVLDDASYNNDATATAGSVSFTSPNLSWTGSLAAGAAATVTFSVTVNNPDTGNKILASTITSASAGNNCASGSTDPRCVTSVSVLVPGLTMVVTANTASTTPGSAVGYTVTVTNSGQTPQAGVSVTDSLAGVLSDASYNGDAFATAGTVSFASPNLTWAGTLAVGAAATVTFSVTVKNPDPGDKLMVDKVTSAAAGSNCPAGGTDPRCSSSIPVLVPGLNITQSAGSATTTPRATVRYTVTVTNSGQTAQAGATFTDPLAGVLDDAAYNGDASATAGTVSFASPDLTWTGDLAVGAAATITFSVTVSNPDTGNKILAATITSATPGSNCAAGSGAAACTSTVNVAVLTISNSSDVSTTTPGGVVRFTATFTNTGQVAYTGITISSNITNVLDDATPNGDQTATSGTLSLTSTGISWTGSIPAGGSVTVTGTVTVNNPDTGNQVLASTLATAAAGSNCPPAGGTDPACSVHVTVLTPALSIVKTANASTAVPGQVIGYTVTITNTGQTPYSGAVVSDSFAQMADDAVYNGNASATAGSLSYASPVLTWTGDLAPGAVAVITYTVTVDNPDAGDKLVINSVSSAATGSSCPPGSVAAACRLTIAVLTPALTIVKTAATTSGSNAVATPGGVVTYTITVTNTGQVPYTGAAFSDPLSGVLADAAYNGDASATAGTVTFTSPVLSWTGDLAPGAAAVITYSVTVKSLFTGNQSLANTVTSATPGSNCPPAGGDARCTVTVTVVAAAALTFAQTASAASAVAGGTVAYTITIVNSGGVAATGASFTDPLGGVLDDAAYNGDAVASSGTVTFASPVLSWTGDVAAGATVTITYTVTVSNPDTGNKILTSTITSPTAGTNCPAASPGLRCTATVTISKLAIDFAASTATTTPGGVVRYTATLANTGQTPYLGITVAFNAPGIADDATGNGDQTATSGTLSVGATGGSWTGDIPAGGTVTITSTVTVNNPDTGDHIMTGSAVTTAPGSNCPAGSADPACTPVTTVLTPGLRIVKTANASTAVPGQVIGYTITITNTGQTPYTGAAVTDSFAQMTGDAVYDGNATATAGSLSFTSPDLTWTGDLAVGGSAVITYTVTVNNPDTGDKLVINSVSSAAAGSTCPPGSVAPACRVTVSVLTPALTITKTASTATATPGSTVTYTITATNTGQVPYPGATFTDPLAGVLDDAAYNHDAGATTGTVSFTSPDLTWTGTLNPGAAATITYTITVHNPGTGDHVLANTVTSTTTGSNCPAGSTDPRCTTTTGVTVLTLTNTASTATTTPGSVVAYTVTITNTGQAAYTAATVTDPLAGVLDDAAYNGDATTTAGSVSFTSPNLTWTGNLAPGAAATITYTITVNNPDTGDKTLTSTLSSAAAGNNCPAGGTDPRCTATVTVLIPALAITKTASVSTTTPGSVVGFTITVHNTGQTPYSGASVTDPLGGVLNDATYNNDGAASTGSVSYASPVLTWTGDLATGQTATITFTVTIASPDLGDKHLVNTAVSAAAGSNCPAGSTDPACTVAVTVLVPALTITKTASVATATPGTPVGYTITVANTGQTPYTGASVTDSLGGVLGDAAYNNNATASTGTVSYASPVLTWTGDLATGQTATITYSVTVSNPDTGSRILSNTAVSAATGSTCPSGATTPGCTATVTIISGALTLTAPASASLGSTGPGGTISANLGTVQVTDSRGFGASWTATVSTSAFTTGRGTPPETIPATDATYGISAFTQTTGSATFTFTPLTNLTTAPQAVTTATNVAGNTTATWNPLINISVPATAVGGTYTATITHSVS